MKRYIIERNIPKISSKTRREMRGAAATSIKALADLSKRVVVDTN